jgi:hypothetical protein
MKKLVSAVFVLVFAVAAAATGRPATAQVPDIVPEPPPPPAQVEPFVQIVSPLSFQACQAPSTAQSLVYTAGAVAGVGSPVQLSDALNPVLDVLLFDLTCAYFRPKIVPPTCEVDDTIFGLAGVNAINTPLPGSIVATEVVAIERALNSVGAPAGSQLSDEVWFQLGCED